MTHAPGPWRFDNDWGRIPTIFDANGNKVASIEKVGGANERHKRTAEQEGSAKLIEAAPKMLEALKSAEIELATWSNASGEGVDCLVEIRQAIADATGTHSPDKSTEP